VSRGVYPHEHRKRGRNLKPTTRITNEVVRLIRQAIQLNYLFRHNKELALKYGVTRHITQKELAEKHGVTQGLISHIKHWRVHPGIHNTQSCLRVRLRLRLRLP
jgi:hypothetical protein